MGPREMRMGSGRDSTTRNFVVSLYPSLNKVGVIKSRRLRWAGHIARMEKCKESFKNSTGKPSGKRPL